MCCLQALEALSALYDAAAILDCDLKGNKMFDMLETNAHKWKCGCNFASLLVCYSESVCIFSVKYDSQV